MTETNDLKIALVGCGRIAKRHADLLSNRQIEGARLHCVCDIQAERAGKFGKQYDVPHYRDMDDMMAREPSVDIVAVLTPSGLHSRHVVNLAKYRKHIIVEKPMALTLPSADDMIAACHDNSVKLFVVKQNRYNYPVRKLREAVEAKRFGKIVLGTVRVRWCRRQEYYDQDDWRGTWALDGGVFANQASHHIDLLEWMLGGVVSVFATSTTALVKIEAEDTGLAILKFASGALGVIEATTATRPTDLEGSVSILGERGTVEIGGFAMNQMKVWRFEDEQEADRLVIGEYAENPPNVYGFGHKAYYDDVIRSILRDQPALVDGLEGRRSLELIIAIYQSIETGQEVRLSGKLAQTRLGKQ
ncbi:MAG: Gfo/Idh/MocA family oxidoreductase [Candidatus Edwardsbacteria bacterium]|nr:Gfo/Idh/MocA family oxidoreductase [Candidatus Edwardsbacteria bacterium]